MSEQHYLQALNRINKYGEVKTDRTGTGTKSIFGIDMRFNLADSFPILTTKKIHIKSVIYELLWMLKGETNIKYLKDNGVRIWNEWANEKGDLGPVYGKQWRYWQGNNGEHIDQISNVIEQVKNDPHSRRIIVNAWNVAEIKDMALPPCHMLFQFYVANGKLSCKLTQRSADFFLGVPFNIASYSLLTHMVAQQCNLSVGEFIWSGGDCHIYANHMQQVEQQLQRTPMTQPKLHIKEKPSDIFSYNFEDFSLDNYIHHPQISASVAI